MPLDPTLGDSSGRTWGRSSIGLGCDPVLADEWTCDGEIAPLRSSDVHAAVARSAPQMSLAEQQASVARLTRRKTPTTSPSAQEKTPSPSPKRRIDRQRLELIALPRELPPPPKPPEPIKARPAPARPQAVATSASEPVLHPGAAAFLAPPRRKVVKLTPQRSMLPGLGSLLFKASLVEEGHVQKEEDRDFWNPRRRTVPRTPSAQRSYVETRLYPKPSAKTGSLEELEQRLQKAREERLALEKQLCDPKPRPGGRPGPTRSQAMPMPDMESRDTADWLQQRDAELFAHMQDWLNRLQVLLDNAVDGEHKASIRLVTALSSRPRQDSPSNKTNGQSINDLAESDQKLFDLLEDWLSRFQLFFLDGQAETPHHAEAESACGSKQLRNKDGDFPSESGRKESNLQSFHGLKALHNSSTGSSMNLVNMYSLDEEPSRPGCTLRSCAAEEETKEVSCRQMCMDMDWPMRSGDPVPPLPFAWQRYLYPYVFSWMFEAFFGFVIISNSIFLGIQVELTASHPGAPPSEAMFVIASIYTLLFTLLLRLLVGGVRTCTQDWAWLALDILVVASSLMEFILEIILRGEETRESSEQSATQNVSTSMRMVRILRVAKITRAIRVVRLVKFIRSLKTLLYCIGRTLRAMAWSGVLLIMIIFLFSLIFTDICTEWRVDEVQVSSGVVGFSGRSSLEVA
eukprot:g25159.t2